MVSIGSRCESRLATEGDVDDDDRDTTWLLIVLIVFVVHDTISIEVQWFSGSRTEATPRPVVVAG